MKKGTIVDFRGSWGSGLATLVVRDGRGKVRGIYCDNGQTVRALDAIFGGVIEIWHGVNMGALKGKTIWYDVDELGVLSSIAPVPEKGVK